MAGCQELCPPVFGVNAVLSCTTLTVETKTTSLPRLGCEEESEEKRAGHHGRANILSQWQAP